MGTSKLFKVLVIMAISLLSQFGQGYSSLFAGNPFKYDPEDSLSLEVTPLVSFMHLPLSYYSLPFCKPPDGVNDKASSNPGRHLTGDGTRNSPYRIRMTDNRTVVFLCQSGLLSATEVDLWKTRIDEMYNINFLLEDLRALRYVKSRDFSVKSIGFGVGSHFSEGYYVYNHLEFKVLVQREKNTNMVPDGSENGATISAPLYTVVGFEVNPCSLMLDDPLASNLTMYDKYPSPISDSCMIESKEIKENESITFTYRVTFEESDINWESRWDAYSLTEGSGVRLPSLINSTITTTLLFVYVLIIFRRRMRQIHAQEETIDAEANAPLIRKSYGPCKLEDVFRAPDCPMLLCAATGTGVQIVGTAIVSTALAALGFLSSAPSGTLVTLMLFLYTILSMVAGFVAARLWRKLGCANPNGWIQISLRVACIFPVTALPILASKKFSVGIISLTETESVTSLYMLPSILTKIWLVIALPFTLVGSFIGSESHHEDTSSATDEPPVKKIPEASMFRSLLFYALAGGLSFSMINIQLSHILSCLRMGYIYNDYGFLCIVVALLLVFCSESSIIFVDKCLLVGDSKWWWKSFFAGASVAVYLFPYLIYNLVYDDELKFMSEPGTVALYVGYIALVCLATMLATGAAGLLSTFWFLRHVFSKMKTL